VASSYLLNPSGTTVKATYGTAFKAPVVYQLYDPVYGNSSLKAETSESWDAGIEQPFRHGRGAVSATYFDSRYTNLIQFVLTNPATYAGTFENVARATSHGIELAVSYKPAAKLSTQLNYTGTEARDETGAVLTRQPSDVFSLTADYQATRKLSLNANGTVVGPRTDQAAPARLRAYTLLNLAGNYRFSTAYSGFLRVDNALNQHYEEAYSYRTPGLGIYGGISRTF
jgi:vitamin B12 transporter